MKVLVLGSGAREHALVWKISQSNRVEKIFAFPGNAGIAKMAEIPNINNSISDILKFAYDEKIDLTVVGPEQYLAEGIADIFNAHNLRIFAPSKDASQLETSKSFAKEMMKKAKIPTAKYFTVTSFDEGKKLLKSLPYPLVLKADGLAAGKGVVIAKDFEIALNSLKEMFNGKFADAGKTVVIEEFLSGEELSLLFFVDGTSVKPLLFSQDHKAAYENDEGPNTGGMGAYAPVLIGTKELQKKVENQVVMPLLEVLKKENIDYKGILYVGLMIVDNKPFVLEFNARFGDPETEPLLFLMKSDILPLFEATIDGKLSDLPEIEWFDGSGATVVLASKGYPGSYEKGQKIVLPKDLPENVFIFHAGTTKKDDSLVSSGGRVLMVTANDKDIKDTMNLIYKTIGKIDFENGFFRKDIAFKELKRLVK